MTFAPLSRTSLLLRFVFAEALGFLNHHLVLAGIQMIQMVEKLMLNCLRIQPIAGGIKYHHMEDDKPLDVPVALADFNQLPGQRMDEVPSHIPFRRSVL